MEDDGRSIEALRDVNSLAVSIALKEEFKEQRKDDAVAPYLNNEGDNHEICDNHTGDSVRFPKHVGACTRRNAHWKSRHSSVRKPRRYSSPCEQAQECFRE